MQHQGSKQVDNRNGPAALDKESNGDVEREFGAEEHGEKGGTGENEGPGGSDNMAQDDVQDFQ